VAKLSLAAYGTDWAVAAAGMAGRIDENADERRQRNAIEIPSEEDN
jgi:hypothetical protein